MRYLGGLTQLHIKNLSWQGVQKLGVLVGVSIRDRSLFGGVGRGGSLGNVFTTSCWV